LRMGSDPLLTALPWEAAPRLELRFGRAEARDRAALSRAVAAAAETGTLFLVSGAVIRRRSRFSQSSTSFSFAPTTSSALTKRLSTACAPSMAKANFPAASTW
jgi:hypothetical protein